jgi:hypothetical protein
MAGISILSVLAGISIMVILYPFFIKYFLHILFVVVYSCKKCGELNYLTPHAFWNTTDFSAKYEKCETINTITLEEGELKKQE